MKHLFILTTFSFVCDIVCLSFKWMIANLCLASKGSIWASRSSSCSLPLTSSSSSILPWVIGWWWSMSTSKPPLGQLASRIMSFRKSLYGDHQRSPRLVPGSRGQRRTQFLLSVPFLQRSLSKYWIVFLLVIATTTNCSRKVRIESRSWQKWLGWPDDHLQEAGPSGWLFAKGRPLWMIIRKRPAPLDYHLQEAGPSGFAFARGGLLRMMICRRPVPLDNDLQEAGPHRMIISNCIYANFGGFCGYFYFLTHYLVLIFLR